MLPAAAVSARLKAIGSGQRLLRNNWLRRQRTERLIFGRGGNDITSRKGDDVVDGGDGNDFIYGEDGNDAIKAGQRQRHRLRRQPQRHDPRRER